MPDSAPEASTWLEVDTKPMSAARRRRHWPELLKRRIVAEALAPGASISLVARRYDVNANQVFAWCRRYRSSAVRASDGAGMIPVAVVPAHDGEPRSGSIEIAFAGGVRVRVSGAVETAALREVLSVLSGR